jgi:hypothetical protein
LELARLLKEQSVTNTSLPDRGVVFWPVGTGDSTAVVVDGEPFGHLRGPRLETR